jgi:GntR family transcriptional regulator
MYLQIAESIRALLNAGTFPVGTLLPPERLLCEAFEVSRMTLRQAFDLLERDQLIQSQRGRGTLVCPPRMRKEIQEMRSFTEEIRSRGGVPQSRLLRFELVSPSSTARDVLQLPAGQDVFRIERLRLNDSIPLALEQVEIPKYLCPTLDRYDLESRSLYHVLESEFSLRLDHSTEIISAIVPSRTHRTLLELPRGVSVLQIERKAFATNNTPVELGVTVYRGDMYRAVVHSTRSRT